MPNPARNTVSLVKFHAKPTRGWMPPDQGKYWEYHDLLFSNPAEKQDHGALLEDAHSLGLDDKKFESCLNGGQFKQQVDMDLQMGTRLGVVGTPGFFVDGISVDGAQPVSVFERIINSEWSSPRTPRVSGGVTSGKDSDLAVFIGF